MAAMKTMMVFVVDAGPSMNQNVDPTNDSGPSKLSLALGLF